jgi:hypothetical protein
VWDAFLSGAFLSGTAHPPQDYFAVVGRRVRDRRHYGSIIESRQKITNAGGSFPTNRLDERSGRCAFTRRFAFFAKLFATWIAAAGAWIRHRLLFIALAHRRIVLTGDGAPIIHGVLLLPFVFLSSCSSKERLHH